MTRVPCGLLALALLVGVWLAGAAPASAQGVERFTLLVTGASGEARYESRHEEWRGRFIAALRDQPGFTDEHLVVLGETPGPGVGRASREGVRAAVDQLAARMTERSVLHVVLIGHGSFDGVDAKFNLVGPDLSAAEWDRWLAPLPGRVGFINTASASAPFLRHLSRPGRIVITATESAAQRFETQFPEFFVEALADQAGDADKDGAVSVLEAFEYASRGVREWYRQAGRLATERALIDDTGDGRGREADAPGPDGLMSARVLLGAGPVRDEAERDPSVAPLVDRREQLLEELAQLRARQSSFTPDAYADALERLLVELSTVSRDIRRRVGSD